MKEKELITRRDFMRVAGLTGAGALLAGCFKTASTPSVAPTATEDVMGTIDALNASINSTKNTNATLEASNLTEEAVVATNDAAVIKEASATAQPTNTATAKNTAMEEATAEVKTSGNWKVETYKGATDQMKTWVTELKDLNPEIWTAFPNVDNSKADFKAKDGLEYGMAESVYCQQDQRCDIPVPAMHYRMITGDYDIAGIDAHTGSEAYDGGGIMIINVGKVTSEFRDAKVDAGFTVFGRYWNGDTLPTAIWAGLSHVGNNMLNLDSKLNPDGSVNAGANCSVPEGCKSVRLVFAIVSGNELLVKGITKVNR